MAQAITAALFHRQRTGEGQFVEIPMMECLTTFNLAEHFHGHVYDPPTGQWGYSRVVNPERKPFATKDGYIGLLPYTDKQWEQFFEAAGLGETLGKDPRFTDYRARAKNIREVYGAVEDITRTKTTDEWLAILKPLHIPVTKMNRPGRLDGRSAPRHRGLVPALRAPGGGRLCEHAAAGEVRRHAGQHPASSATAGRAHRRGARGAGVASLPPLYGEGRDERSDVRGGEVRAAWEQRG